MKTPEQMAGEYAHANTSYGHSYSIARGAFLAGYQAAEDEMNSSNNLNSWISVKERLPEDRESVIYWHDLHGVSIGRYDSTYPKPNYHWWSYSYGDNADFRVHWWMPLPKIPEAPKGGKDD